MDGLLFIQKIISKDVKITDLVRDVTRKNCKERGNRMNFDEILKAAGLDETAVEKVKKDMTENKIFTTAEENIETRYQKLQEKLTSKETELATANELIEDLKKNNGDNEELKNKISTYESDVNNLKEQLVKSQTDSAVKLALAKAGAKDIDYLMYKLTADKTELKLDEKGGLVGADDIVKGLKEKFEGQFESQTDPKGKNVLEKGLPSGKDPEDKPLTLGDAIKEHYGKE